ncbi:ferritin-like domain-containing protein [Roseomonas sp. SSH11]|uniref:Ferritin-like domain-containing protein n=1 Tax=Pararoseomonas baculiformis TaxID=2820812 RepID=A0ABS4ALG1_9PROT|nr:ferritin-like domain-containing protein [Pararoseomonas baculiformis]MBP0447877.1 ferritin-like domain-containing protein [Pararoseomonas baculiformis]
MTDTETSTKDVDLPALQADLVDLLQLENDALPMYSVALSALRDPALREKLRVYREDHERHARDLTALIRELGGVPPVLPHLPTGLLKLGVQMAGLPGGDRTILMAFISNEWQSREKYARFAVKPYPPAMAALIGSHAADEEVHYLWATEALRGLGCGEETLAGQMTLAFARMHGSAADLVEGIGRRSNEAVLRLIRRR